MKVCRWMSFAGSAWCCQMIHSHMIWSMSIYVDLVPWPFLVGGFKRFFEITLNIAGKQQNSTPTKLGKNPLPNFTFFRFWRWFAPISHSSTRPHNPTTPSPSSVDARPSNAQGGECASPVDKDAIREARRGNGVLHQSWCAICPEVMHITRNESKWWIS